MTTIQRLSFTVTAIAAAALLSACGGGGDDAVQNGGLNAAGSADAYVGTWKSPCEDQEDVTLVAAPAEVLKSTATVTLTKVTSTRLSAVYVWNYYRAASGCVGTPVATQTNASVANTVVLDGAVTVGGIQADKATFRRGSIGGDLVAGGNIVVDGVVYPGNYFSSNGTYKDLIRVTGNQLQMGNDDEDAQGYPTAIDTTFALIRQ